jgi:hypothetical protein
MAKGITITCYQYWYFISVPSPSLQILISLSTQYSSIQYGHPKQLISSVLFEHKLAAKLKSCRNDKGLSSDKNPNDDEAEKLNY